MNRITKFLSVAAVGAAAVVGLASQAGATVAVDNGVGHVDKGDVQSALKWNNGDFDRNAGSIKFTADATATYDNVLTCGANADNKVVHVLSTSTSSGSGVLDATPVKSSNGKQITGWNLTGGTASATNDLNKVMQATFTACLPDKPYSEMTPEELRRLPVKVDVPSTPSVAFSGLKVNGVDLPNTPVAELVASA
jgi:hypothetical protein